MQCTIINYVQLLNLTKIQSDTVKSESKYEMILVYIEAPVLSSTQV